MENPEAALIGAAMCAAVGTGIYPDFISAGKAFVKYGTTYEPNQKHSAVYEKSYERFVRLMKLSSEENIFVI
jgi:ribulose kinase